MEQRWLKKGGEWISDDIRERGGAIIMFRRRFPKPGQPESKKRIYLPNSQPLPYEPPRWTDVDDHDPTDWIDYRIR